MKSRRPVPITDEKFPLLPKLIATSLGVGYLPWMPGTWGALLAILLWLPFCLWTPGVLCFCFTIAATVLLTVFGTWASTVSEKYWGKDPVAACADETVGQWLSLLPLCGGIDCSSWWLVAVAFVLFRAFDIIKPFGIRRLENLPGGYGMMADDIAAGVLAALITWVLNIAIYG